MCFYWDFIIVEFGDVVHLRKWPCSPENPEYLLDSLAGIISVALGCDCGCWGFDRVRVCHPLPLKISGFSPKLVSEIFTAY